MKCVAPVAVKRRGTAHLFERYSSALFLQKEGNAVGVCRDHSCFDSLYLLSERGREGKIREEEEGEGRAVRASVRSCCSFKKANGRRKICELKAGSVLGFGFFPLELVAR